MNICSKFPKMFFFKAENTINYLYPLWSGVVYTNKYQKQVHYQQKKHRQNNVAIFFSTFHLKQPLNLAICLSCTVSLMHLSVFNA